MTEDNLKIQNSSGQAAPGNQTEPAAEPAASAESAVLVKSGVVFKGAQEFVVTTSAINLEKPGALTKSQVALVEKVLRPSLLSGRSVLDISPRPGYFAYLASLNQASQLVLIDSSPDFVDLLDTSTKHLGLAGFTSQLGDWRTSAEPSDVVLALDSSQWFGANNSGSKFVNETLAKIASLTRYAAFIQESDAPPVTPAFPNSAIFETMLRSQFKRVVNAGEADGKRVYACYQSNHEIDLSCPLPEFEERGTLISSRQLTEFAGLDYWSRVYDAGEVIYKQATRELIRREEAMLSLLQSSFFPKVIEVRDCEDSSILVMEKIKAKSLDEASEFILDSIGNFTLFALECFQILNELQVQGIQHRDIQPGNLLIRDGVPVLIDFGWAVSKEFPMFVPAGLLSVSEDAQVCDAFSMGKILADLSAKKYPELACVFNLMTEPDPIARVTGAQDLSALLKLAAAAAASLPASAADLAMSPEQSALLTKLITNLKINRARLEASHKNYEILEEKSKSDRDHRLAVLESEYDLVVTEVNRVIAELHRVIGEKDQLLELLNERQKLIEGITQGQAWRLANRLQKSKQTFGSMFGKSP